MASKEEKNPLEAWLEDHPVLDKDAPSSDEPEDGYFPFQKLKPEDFRRTDYRKTQKFIKGEADLFEEWLERNPVIDKDNELSEAEHRMYPAHLGIPNRVNAELDLHGLTVAEALKIVQWFVQESFRKNRKVIKIIHGKGKHSKGGAKIKTSVINWLHQYGKAYIRYIKPADRRQGGMGATIVWLK